MKAVFKSERKKIKGDLSIIFTDNKLIQRLNKKFLNENHPTDVIAFPYKNNVFNEIDFPFGDIFISVPEARSNAKKFGEKPHREVIRLIVHGLLHLLGYDDHNSKDKAIMWKKQEKLVHDIAP